VFIGTPKQPGLAVFQKRGMLARRCTVRNGG
jgi:hypothetical protein